MDLLITMSMADYNKMLADAKDQKQKKADVELALYWAHRVMGDYPESMTDFLKILKDRGMSVERKGTKMVVERTWL